MNPDEITVVSSGAGRLHVRFTTAVKTKDSSRLFAEIGERARADGVTELLIDASAIREKLSVVRRLQMILGFVASLRGFRVAGVLSETTVDPKRLGETMARNRGANVRVFTKLPEALAWLGWGKSG
jgi:hypothetical protein